MKSTSSPTAELNAANRRILVVDDNPAIHSDIRKILCPTGVGGGAIEDLEGILFEESPKRQETPQFDLFSAFQGQEALEMVRRSMAEGTPYAVAFMDVRMPPGWDGIETISRIWEIDPSIQMVVCTAYSDYSWDEMRNRLGQPESLVVLKKPFDNVEVQQLAHALTRKWQLNLKAETATSHLEGVIGYMKSLLEMERRLMTVPTPVSADIRNGKSETGVWLLPTYPGIEVSAIRGPDENDRKQQLADVLMHLKTTLETTFRQLRETEMQLIHAEKMASLGRLSAGIMHEINNPLNHALTAIELSANFAESVREDKRGEFQENTRDIKSGLLRISKIVQDLREFTGPNFRVLGPTDLGHSVETALRIMVAELPPGVEIENRIPPGFQVHGVSSRLTQVFLNLFQNSVDALKEKTYPEGMRPCIRLEAIEEQGVKTCRIWDNGAGIAPHDCGRIFDPFFTTKEAGQGTGLGLSICYRLLRDVGAGIRVRSERGEFCEFTLTFPGESTPMSEATDGDLMPALAAG